MSALFQFAKYSACGNDFILVDNRQQSFPPKGRALIPSICHRRFGIGADGVIFLELSNVGDCCMRIFNSDGSEAEMCGNGVRCLAFFFRELGFPKQKFLLETMHQLLEVDILTDELVSVNIGDPTHMQWNVPITFSDKTFHVHLIDTGVPHLILFTDDIDHADMVHLAPSLRARRDLAPKGSNVDFVMWDAEKQLLFVRTFERGVEGETPACGTGVLASAIAAAKILQIDSPLSIQVQSGDVLQVAFDWNNDFPSNVSITGEAKKVFQGECDLSLLNRTSVLHYTLGIV